MGTSVQEIEMIRPGKEKGMFEGYLLEIETVD